MAVGSLFLLSACATATDPAKGFPGESGDRLFSEAEKALKKDQYKEAIRRYEALDVQYPYSAHSEMAQLHLIYAHYQEEDYPSTEAAADRYLRVWPASGHADYAWYMRALASYQQNLGIFERLFPVKLSRRDLDPLRKAWADFAVVARQFPGSRYVPAARQYMIYLRNLMAHHELEVGQYYYSRRAFVAASNRAAEVIRHYQGAPAVRPALHLLADSFHALHAFDSEKEVRRVILNNHY